MTLKQGILIFLEENICTLQCINCDHDNNGNCIYIIFLNKISHSPDRCGV